MVKREPGPPSLFAASPSLPPLLPCLTRQSPVGVACAFVFDISPPPFPLPANEKGARDGEERPLRRRAKDARPAQKRRLGSLDVASLLHCRFGAGLSLRERLVDCQRSGERRGEVLPDIRADALE